MNLIETIDGYGIVNPTKIAHVYEDNSMTYKELYDKSNALALYIISKYGTENTPIAVYGHKQHEMLICFLACVKAGHSYIPIDSSFPLERVKDIIEGSETKLIFNIENKEIDFLNIKAESLAQLTEAFNENFGKKLSKNYRVKAEDTFYMIYTSGSTGKPKGVQITLSCLESFVSWGLELCKGNLDQNAVFMNQAPFSFDLSVMDLYISLASSSTLFSIDKAMISNLKLLFENFKKSAISIWVSTPSFAEMCLADSSFNEKLLPNLKLLLFCGETLPNSCVSKIYDRFTDVKVINTYGPTEATVAVTSIEITRDLNSTTSPLPVGKVKEDCQILIVDEKGNKAKDNEKGEITIAGDSVSVGYYKNEEMTKMVFSKRIMDGVNKRSYKTGDEGYLKDGILYYCGRIDFQIKLNGYRIELEDIENNLRKVSNIKNAVIIPINKEGRIQYLAAAVVLNKQIEEKEFKIVMSIKNELKKLLPDYMIPRKIVIKESLPMTANGKVNRKMLTEEIQ
jgi:D-alanine--poly(phosphoribitol) ligase subunit 1